MKSGRHVVLITLHADPARPSGVGGWGGTHAYIRELMLGLTQNRWNVTVLTRWEDLALPERESITSNLRLIRLQIGELAPIDKRLLDGLHPVSLRAARSVLQDFEGINLLHSVYWNSGRLAKDLASDLGIGFVHTVISNGWRRRLQGAHDEPASRRPVEQQVFHSASAIFCISQQERADLIDHYDVNPGKLVVVGRPVASTFLRPCHDESGRPAHLGRIEAP